MTTDTARFFNMIPKETTVGILVPLYGFDKAEVRYEELIRFLNQFNVHSFKYIVALAAPDSMKSDEALKAAFARYTTGGNGMMGHIPLQTGVLDYRFSDFLKLGIGALIKNGCDYIIVALPYLTLDQTGLENLLGKVHMAMNDAVSVSILAPGHQAPPIPMDTQNFSNLYFATKKFVLEAIGLAESNFYTPYYGLADIMQRLRARGFECIAAGDAMANPLPNPILHTVSRENAVRLASLHSQDRRTFINTWGFDMEPPKT